MVQKYTCKCGAVGVVSADPFIEGRFMIAWWNKEHKRPHFDRGLHKLLGLGRGRCQFTSRAKTLAQAQLDGDI